MSELNRNYGPPFVVLIGVFIFLFLAWLNNHQDYREPSYSTAKQEHIIASAIPAPPANQEPDRKEWREETDLQAQRNMSKWALAMFIVSGAGVIVAVFGLLFIKETLLATQKAAKYAFDTLHQAKLTTKAANDTVAETKRIGEAQVRAYLSIVDLSVVVSEEGITHKLRVTVKNSGQTPAYLKHCSARAAIGHRIFFVEWDDMPFADIFEQISNDNPLMDLIEDSIPASSVEHITRDITYPELQSPRTMPSRRGLVDDNVRHSEASSLFASFDLAFEDVFGGITVIAINGELRLNVETLAGVVPIKLLHRPTIVRQEAKKQEEAN